MTHLHRLVVGTILIAGFATTSRAAEPDKLLPATSDTVVQVNIRQLLDSDIAKKYAIEQIKQALDGRDLKNMLAEVGLDPLKDIDQLVIGMSGSSKSDVKGLAILHGKFSPNKLYKVADAQTKKDPDKFNKITEGNTVIFKYLPDGGDQAIYFTVIDENTVVAGTEKKLITTAVSTANSEKTTPVSKELAALVNKMDEKASVYVVSIVKGKLDEVKIPGGGNLPVDLSSFQDLLAKINSLSLSVQVKTDVNLQVTLGMKDEDSAGDFRSALDDLLKQLKPLAQIAGAAEPRAKPLSEVMSTIKTSTKEKDVVIVGKVTGANIGKIVNPNTDD